MRPKKKVLLYCADAYLIGMVSFAMNLRLRTAHVYEATTYEEVIAAGKEHDFESVVVYRTKKHGESVPDDGKVFRLIEANRGRAGIVEICNGFGPHPSSLALFRVAGSFPIAMVDIAEATSQSLSRKRGPSGIQHGFRLSKESVAA